MRTLILTLALAAAIATPAAAQPKLRPELAGIGFLVGDWTNGTGKVADTGDTDRGGSKITVEADGAALLRQDHTETFDAKGKRTGAFHQVMLIYPEGGTLRADYADGEGHVIHYTSAEIDPGRLAVFTAPATAGRPGFRLTYRITTSAADPRGDLIVDFEMLPPGGSGARPIASGLLHRAK